MAGHIFGAPGLSSISTSYMHQSRQSSVYVIPNFWISNKEVFETFACFHRAVRRTPYSFRKIFVQLLDITATQPERQAKQRSN